MRLWSRLVVAGLIAILAGIGINSASTAVAQEDEAPARQHYLIMVDNDN